MSLLFLLFTLLDDRPHAGLERATTPPNVVHIALRMPFLKKGMTEADVSSILGVDDYLLRLGGGTLRTWIVQYPVRPGFRLTEVYRVDPNSNRLVLEEATLQKEIVSSSNR